METNFTKRFFYDINTKGEHILRKFNKFQRTNKLYRRSAGAAGIYLRNREQLFPFKPEYITSHALACTIIGKAEFMQYMQLAYLYSDDPIILHVDIDSMKESDYDEDITELPIGWIDEAKSVFKEIGMSLPSELEAPGQLILDNMRKKLLSECSVKMDRVVNSKRVYEVLKKFDKPTIITFNVKGYQAMMYLDIDASPMVLQTWIYMDGAPALAAATEIRDAEKPIKLYPLEYTVGVKLLSYAYKQYKKYKNAPTRIEVVEAQSSRKAPTTSKDSSSDVDTSIVRVHYVNTKVPKERKVYIPKGGTHASPCEHIRHYPARVLKSGKEREAFEIVVNEGHKKKSSTVTVYKV